MTYIYNKEISYTDSSHIDAIGRLRTSDVTTVFESTLKYNNEAILWDEVEENGGTVTYDSDEKMVHLDVSASGDRALRQTKEYFHLRSGKSHIGIFAGNLHTSQSGCIKRMGFFDDENGVFFEHNDTDGLKLVLRTDSSGTVEEQDVLQSNWSLDKMDGSGPSGITINTQNMQIFFIDFSWTGAGRIRIGALYKGEPVYFHELESANNEPVNIMGTPALPIRHENISEGGSGKLREQSCCVLVEASESDNRNISRSINTGTTAYSVSTGSLQPVLALRLKDEYNKAKIKPSSVSVVQISNNSVLYYEVRTRIDSIDSTNWQSVSNLSIAEACYDATSFTGGIVIKSGFLPPKMGSPLELNLDSIIPVISDINNNRDIVTLNLEAIGGSIDAFSEMSFKEVY